MEVTGGAEEGFVREWTPCSHILSLIPPRIQNGLFSNELCLTCVDACPEYIALGTNVGLVYWYDRKKGNIQRLRCEASTSPITYVKIVSTVDYMVGAGNAAGQVTVFQIPKEHPENLPDNLKPKVEQKVERYTIGDLHKSKITAIEWSKNGMRLFSGDKNGIIIMTEIDFYMHLCKSQEIVNEEHEIVQLSYSRGALLVSSLYRTIACQRQGNKWHVAQIGKKERKSLCAVGAVLQYCPTRGGAEVAYCGRQHLRVWRADIDGTVQHTLLFKEAISNPLTVAELLNPSQKKHTLSDDDELGPLYVFREHFLVSHNDRLLYILDPRSLTAVAVVDDLRRILSVSVSREEIFILEGPRSLVRLAHSPEPPALTPEEPINVMSKSLTTSIQQAVNTVRDLTQLENTVPYITSVLEQPIAMFTKNEVIDGTVANAEECFELPPIKQLPKDISENVLESIVNEFKDSSDVEEIRRIKSEEIEKKLKMYRSIMERKCDEELIHSSRRSGRVGVGAGGRSASASPRRVRATRPASHPAVITHGNIDQQNDDLLERQIEEKEKILAKMLNLESLSIPQTLDLDKDQEDIVHSYNKQKLDEKPVNIEIRHEKNSAQVKPAIEKPIKNQTNREVLIKENALNLIPKIVKLPNNWNLENIEVKLDIRSDDIKIGKNLVSPDDTIDGEWEII